MNGYEIHKQEQEEARQAEAFRVFKQTMNKLNQDHDEWVKRNNRHDQAFKIFFIAILTISTAAFIYSLIMQATK